MSVKWRRISHGRWRAWDDRQAHDGCDARPIGAASAAPQPEGTEAIANAAPRPFLPARDFAASKRFYEALGFQMLLDGDVAIFAIGSGGFILQDYYQQAWAENCMMQLMVDDLDAWWAHIETLDLPARFGVQSPRPPVLQPWGLRVAYLFDPSGVLWHIAERRPGVAWD